MPDDIDSPEIGDELTNSSGENQNDGVEDNSHSEGNKNQSNFKKLAKRLKQERKENERLKAELAKHSTGTDSDDGEEDFDIDDDTDSDEAFSDEKSEIFFLKNKDAEQYREEMSELLEDNPRYKSLSLKDLYDLAKARFPKSTSKKPFEIWSGRWTTPTDVSKIDISKLTAEEIEALPLDAYRKLFSKKK